MKQVLLAAGVCFAGFSSPMPGAQAQEVAAKDIARCAEITTDAERLACYDRLSHSTAQKPAAAASPPELSAQSFGIRVPTAQAALPSRLNAKVLQITTDSHGMVVVQLDNDQSWTIDDGTAILRPGDGIVIKRAALGSFLMTTPTKRVYRVRRIR